MKVVKISLYLLLAIALTIGGYFGFQLYIKAKTPALDALYILPNNAAIIISFNNYSSYNAKMNDENLIWQDLRNTYNLDAHKSSLDSLLNTLKKDPHFQALLEEPNHAMYISYHFTGHNKFESVYSINAGKQLSESNLKDYLNTNFTLTELEFEAQIIYKITSKSTLEPLFITYNRGVVSICAQQQLAEKITLSALSANPDKQILKKRMLKVSGKNVLANVYVNYNFFYRLLSKYTTSGSYEHLKDIKHLSQRAVLDAQFKTDRILLSGLSIQNDSFPSFLQTYQGFQPSEIRVANILPSNTSFMYFQGAEQISQLLIKRSKGSFSERNNKILQGFKAKYLVDLGDYFYPWMKDELVFALCKTRSSDQSQGAYAIIKTTDLKEANQALQKLTKTIVDIKGLTQDSTLNIYRKYVLHNIPKSNILPALFGQIFTPIENTYYTNIDNYIVFANSYSALKNIIDSYLIERVLANNDTYKKTIDDIGNETNILVYANLHFLRTTINKHLSKAGLDLINESGLAFNNFESVALEYIAYDNGTYTSFVLHHGDKQEIDEPISWKTALDNPIQSGPYWIKNHKTNSKEIIVFDKSNLMYRIDQNGSIAWAIPIMEKPLSKIYMIDYYQNGKYQYMFNSKNYIYLFDLNGNRVENYPIKLPNAASGPMTIVDYDHNKNYRILIPMTDNKIYNFKIDGSQTVGWKFQKMKNPIHNMVQFFKLGSKDFLIVSDTSGNVIYTNRRGEARMDADLSFTNNPHTAFYKKQEGSSKSIITTDLMGRIVSINSDGNVSKTLLHEFSPEHYFYYYDFNKDQHKDYIFIDNNELFVFNHRNKLILQKQFEQNISDHIIGISINTQDNIRLVLHDNDHNTLLLISEQGELINTDNYSSSAKFAIDEIRNSKMLRIVTTNGRIIGNFLQN